MADVPLTPAGREPNTVEIGVMSPDGAPLDPPEVRISFADPAPGVEPLRFHAVRRRDLAGRAGPAAARWRWTVRLDVVSDFAKAALEATAPVADR